MKTIQPIRIDWSDGAKTRALNIAGFELSITRESKYQGRYWFIRVLGPGPLNLKVIFRPDAIATRLTASAS